MTPNEREAEMLPIREHKCCPSCGEDWRDGEGSKVIAVVDPDIDMVAEWMCPFCQARWPRNAKSRLRSLTAPVPTGCPYRRPRRGRNRC